jgi:hypothetical protein
MSCHWCGGDCGGTCLGLTKSTQMQTNDPAYFLLKDGHTSTPTVHREGCYICEDPEFAQMGLPLCQECPQCGGHIPADDPGCDDCDYDAREAWAREQATTPPQPKEN